MSFPNLELCRLRQAKTFRDYCEIWAHQVPVVDLEGGWDDALVLTGTHPCRIGSLRDDHQEREYAERLGIRSPVIVTLPVDTLINERDRLVIGTRKLDVMRVRKVTFNTALQCLCDELI